MLQHGHILYVILVHEIIVTIFKTKDIKRTVACEPHFFSFQPRMLNKLLRRETRFWYEHSLTFKETFQNIELKVYIFNLKFL